MQSLHFHCREVLNFCARSIFVLSPTYLSFFQVVILQYYKERSLDSSDPDYSRLPFVGTDESSSRLILCVVKIESVTACCYVNTCLSDIAVFLSSYLFVYSWVLLFNLSMYFNAP